MKTEDLEGLRVAILGLGVEGQAAHRWLRSRFPKQALTLIAEAPADEGFLAELTQRDAVRVAPLGEAALHEFDVLLRSPGISPYREELCDAQDQGATIIAPGSLWFAANPTAKTICITGTKGKSTTASLIAHILARLGIDVQLAGNIGRPLLACGSLEADWWVIELSSYQLVDLQGHASIAVILNLDQDHLDWHGGVEPYYRDKLKLLDMLATDGVLVANWNDPAVRREVSSVSGLHWFNHAQGIGVSKLQICQRGVALPGSISSSLPGPHNLANLAAALTVLKSLGISPIKGMPHVASFSGLAHRLQEVSDTGRFRCINDSIASAPLATVAAVESFPDDRAALIVGGMDRGVDWFAHIGAIAAMRPAAVIGIPDNGPAIVAGFEATGLFPQDSLYQAKSLREAVNLARRVALPNGLILLSPGAPSFPHFRDYRERGQQFARLCQQVRG